MQHCAATTTTTKHRVKLSLLLKRVELLRCNFPSMQRLTLECVCMYISIRHIVMRQKSARAYYIIPHGFGEKIETHNIKTHISVPHGGTCVHFQWGFAFSPADHASELRGLRYVYASRDYLLSRALQQPAVRITQRSARLTAHTRARYFLLAAKTPAAEKSKAETLRIVLTIHGFALVCAAPPLPCPRPPFRNFTRATPDF